MDKSCLNCKWGRKEKTFRGEFECDWLYQNSVRLPRYLGLYDKHLASIAITTDACYPKRFKEDLAEKCSVYEEIK